MIRDLSLICISIAVWGSAAVAQPQVPPTTPVIPLANAHAHNDYEHARPLLDALEQGFTSIEADVYLVDGQLLVAHNLSDVAAERTLEGLYLSPLREIVRQNEGRVYRDGPTVTLLVDIKSDGKATYAVLSELLTKYASVISETREGEFTEKAITVVISGNRALEEIEKSNPRLAGVDGRVADLDSNQSATLLPLISDNWTNHFSYRGTGPMPEAERKKLRDMVDRAHARGRRIRFWATAESPELWSELKAAKVDLIGTDELEMLSSYLRSRP